MTSDPISDSGIKRIEENVWEIPRGYKAGMRVPGIIFADYDLQELAVKDKAFEQVANVAFLPGIERASMAMPDIHWGYGFPIGGVAATRISDGVISPGGVGFDISCGVRLLRTGLEKQDVLPRMREIVHEFSRSVPKGLGGKGKLRLSSADMDRVLKKGAAWCVENGYGWPEDLSFIEQKGTYPLAEPASVSQKAKDRGLNQLGTLGSGNHFLEIQEVAQIFDTNACATLGLHRGQVVIMIHSGSRGLGHQVCTDFLKKMGGTAEKEGFVLPDRQLACAYIESEEGRDYSRAMQAAANFGLANRQTITHWVRQSMEFLYGLPAERLGMGLVYDVSHNIAQIETHEIDGKPAELCVHRKGATRAFGPGHPDLPAEYSNLGQPVIVPGDMGTASYVLVGTAEAMRRSWGSTCHGAGRLMSRKAAVKKMGGAELRQELEAEGIIVAAGHVRTLSEEAPYAYKDVNRVVDVCDKVGLSRKAAKLKPLGVLKG